jgi:uncharacterized protein
VLVVAWSAGCVSSSSKPASSANAAPPPSRCADATLGLEAAPISRALRRKVALPDGFKGAVVREVVAGGPAAAAGIQPDDVVVSIGGRAIANDCDLDDAALTRSCNPVDVSFRRAGVTIERRVVPVEQRALYDRACASGVVSACFRQAWDLWRRSGGRGPDSDRALELYQKACLAGSSDACADEGHHLMERPDRANDTIAVLELSCDLGSAAGCAHFAFLYATGKLVTKDDKKSASLYAKSCDLGDAKGCYNAGLMAEEGRGVGRDLARAIARYEEACEGGSSTGCTNLGFHYEHGRGLKKDPARAVELYQRGCDGTTCQPSNLAGCVNVGRANRDGIGVAKNAARAAEIFGNACERAPSPEDVDAHENRSRACSLLGGLYLAGDGVEKSVEKGRELSERGCEGKDAFGCFNAAVVATDPAKAAAFLDRACQAGDGEGCRDLAVAYEKGNGVARDRRRAAELYKKSCELGFKDACRK